MAALCPLTFALFVLFLTAPAAAQTPERFSLDSSMSFDLFRGQNAADRPNIIIDITGVARIGGGWLLYVRPWFRQPRTPEWDKQIYQAALQYERSGPISTRIDLGYIVSPIGLGMMDTRPSVNPTIAAHLAYFTPMPVFDPRGPRISAIASTYPLGGQVTFSADRWDARAAVVNSAPTRIYAINRDGNPRSTPVLELGGGITPTTGLRVGISLARGNYATGEELTVPTDEGHELTLIGFEGEYAFNYTKISGELIRDRLETTVGTETAAAWFIQGLQTISPRWFLAARQEGTSAPPLRTGTAVGSRTKYHSTEATVGFRLSPEFTLRGSFLSRKAYTRTEWDQQAGASVVWAHRWW
jgi:hypothetical protein